MRSAELVGRNERSWRSANGSGRWWRASSSGAGRHGRLVETGTPDELKARLQGDSLHIRVADVEDVGAGAEVLAGVGEITEVDRGQGSLDVRVPNGAGLLPDALRRLDREGLVVTAAEIRRPGLDDVLFALTGDGAPGTEDGNGAPAKSKTRKFAFHGRG